MDQSQSDELSQAADRLSENLNTAGDASAQLGDTIGKAVDDGIAGAEKSLDTFLSGLDNLLGKF